MDSVNCPFCGAKRTDLYEDFTQFDDEEVEVECWNCGKTYTIGKHVIINFYTIPKSKVEAK